MSLASVAGGLGQAAGFVAGNWARLAVYGALILSLLGVVWMHGYFKGSAKLADYKASQALKTADIIVRRGAVSVRTITRYVAVKAKTDASQAVVAKEVENYASINPGLCLDPAWRRLHDRAALNAVSEPTGGTDDKGRTAEASTGGNAPYASSALAGVTQNYAACHRTADRLDALQGWVIDQEKVH
jgi:hypothetical protein